MSYYIYAFADGELSRSDCIHALYPVTALETVMRRKPYLKQCDYIVMVCTNGLIYRAYVEDGQWHIYLLQTEVRVYDISSS